MLRSKLFFGVTLAILSIFIGIRLALPYALHRYAEYRLNQIPEYQAQIGDIKVHLWRGSYTVENINLKKINKNIPVPFFAAQAVDFQIEWRALLQGALVGQITITKPEINFVTDPSGKNEQLTMDQQWQQAVEALFPLNFNTIVIHQGAIHYRSYAGDPPFDIYLKEVNAQVSNLRKIEKTERRLSSYIKATGKGMDNSPVKLEIALDPFASKPAFKLNASIEKMTVPTANDFLHHYTKLDIQQGYFSLYVEVAAAKGKITGYAKPMIKDLQVIDPKEQTNPVKAIYKGAVQVVAKILENEEQGTVATKIKIHGEIEDPEVNIWSMIGNLLRHAFIQALLPQIDHSVKVQDIDLNR
ncbi:MAG: hypothetical protein K0S11_576 [Gammaproteobacteria bacterium]|jgi:hypothetical protein|nr:hypothetical protein [Gammaproteobacteria bacterium]